MLRGNVEKFCQGTPFKLANAPNPLAARERQPNWAAQTKARYAPLGNKFLASGAFNKGQHFAKKFGYLHERGKVENCPLFIAFDFVQT
jgi:hypothetical protein